MTFSRSKGRPYRAHKGARSPVVQSTLSVLQRGRRQASPLRVSSPPNPVPCPSGDRPRVGNSDESLRTSTPQLVFFWIALARFGSGNHRRASRRLDTQSHLRGLPAHRYGYLAVPQRDHGGARDHRRRRCGSHAAWHVITSYPPTRMLGLDHVNAAIEHARAFHRPPSLHAQR